MFTPLHLLPQYNAQEFNKYYDRWNTRDGRIIRDRILQVIRDGAGEDFLLWKFEQGNLGFLENMHDLKGLVLYQEDINFPTADNFKAIDFSYASFYSTKLRNATFFETSFSFLRLSNCEFINCVFSFTTFYGATLERTRFINCDFIDHDSFNNCNLRNVKFENCFIPTNFFFDCKFDEQTAVNDPLDEPLIMGGSRPRLKKAELAEIFKGIKEAYMAGNVINQARRYFFKERQCITRYNAKSLREKMGGFFLELVAGYGIKPFRVLLTMLTIFTVFSLLFIVSFGFSDGLLLSAGGFFTFGANTHYLLTACDLWKVLYIAESFFGISLMALFITVLANLWFKEK
jgi:uncharacterized protein YjbI with pentapeptide repeats